MKTAFVFLLAAITMCLTGCKSPFVTSKSCITQPFTDIKQQRGVVVDIAGKLQEIPIDANLKVGFTNVLQQNFSMLSDKNVSQLLFLQAIDCYLNKAAEHPNLLPIIEPLIKDMALAVLRMFGASQGISGATARLDDNQIDAIKKSPYGDLILSRYQQFGIH